VKGKQAMNTFIKKNEKFLRISFSALRISGWFLLVFSLCCPVISIVLLRNYKPGIGEEMSITMLLIYLTLMFFGLLGIGLAQLIRYLLDSNYKPGFILRHGDKFIYAYVVLTLIAATKHFFDLLGLLFPFDRQLTTVLCISATQIVYLVAKALILLGMAQLLKRLMPIMDEHKSLI
jgi:hypothetical protein